LENHSSETHWPRRPSRYSTAEETHIVAVLDAHPLLGEDSLIDALFGDEVLHVAMSGENGALAMAMGRRNAFWTPSQNTRVSGVLYAREIMPWSIATRPPTLWVKEHFGL
jgi:hypothetical protein